MALLIVSISVSENAIINIALGRGNIHFVHQAILLSERLSFLIVGLGLIHNANVSIHIHQSMDGREKAKHTTTAGAAVWSTGTDSVAGADIFGDGIYLRGVRLKGIRED